MVDDAARNGPTATASADDGTAAYPARWEVDVALSDGGTMAVRPIRPDDDERLVAFHERQSPESIYFRYFSPRPRLSARDLERFTNVDYVDRMAFVGLIGDDIVGVARYDRHQGRSDAEVAFFIDDAHHGRGMATVLLEYLAVAAREVGISGFTASVLPQNRKMLGVFTQAGFTAHSHFEEGVIEVELGIEPTPEALAAIEARAAKAEARSVERLLRPSSIAVIGASREQGSIGYEVFHQLVSRGFEGPVFPVNPDASYVASVRAWRSVVDIPGEVDLAVICVPAEQVLEVVAECAVQHVRGLIVLSSGFADSGAEGEQREAALVAYARRHGMRVIGPNALGAINTDPTVRMHATFADVDPIPGRVALMAQSGVIGAAIIDAASSRGLGISSFVAAGNKADVSGNDLLRYWGDDPDTDVVMLYLESFGNPAKFSRIARDLSRSKPIVAVKVGGSVDDVSPGGAADDGMGADGIGDGSTGGGHADTAGPLLEQAGVIRVDNLTQMFHAADVLANQPLPAGRRVTVVTSSWGPAWLAMDALHARGLETADPVDLSNVAEPEDFSAALARVYADETVHAVLVIHAPALRSSFGDVAAAIRRAAGAPGAVTTVACLLGEHPAGMLSGDDAHVPEFPFPEEAAMALGRVAAYAEWRRQPVGEPLELAEEVVDRAQELVHGWLGDDAGREALTWLGPLEAAELLDTVGLAPAHQELVRDPSGLVPAARAVGYPVALKAAGLRRLTKTEAGGVSLDVHGDDEVRAAYDRMSELLGDAMRPAIVQAMVPEGIECRVGVFRHARLGDVLTLGPGGSLAERVGGEAMRIFPITDVDAERLIDGSTIGPLMDAEGPAAKDALRDLIVRLAALADAIPEIVQVRLNPVLVVDGSAAITDAKVALATFRPDGRPAVRHL